MNNPERHSIITLNLHGIRRPELAVIFRDIQERMTETRLQNWDLTVIEDVDSDLPQNAEETIDAMMGNEHDGFAAFLDAEGLS